MDRPSAIGPVPRWVWVVLLVMALLWLLGPRVSGWQLLHLHKEDGDVFLQEWVLDGWDSIFAPYTGYQHLGPRAATAACAAGPVTWFAPCVGAASAVVRILLAIVAAAVLVPYARTRAWGVAAGFLFVFVPVGQQEVLGNLTNLRWFFDVGCLVICLGLFRGSMAVLAAVLGFVGAMSDPLVMLLLPLALWRVVTARKRSEALPAVAVALGAVCQWALLVPSARPTDIGWFVSEPVEALTQLMVRGGAVAQFGQNGAEVLATVSVIVAVVAGLVPVVLVVAARPVGPPRLVIGFLMLAGFGLLACTLVFAPRAELTLEPAWRLGNASRYAVGPSILIGAALLLAASYATSVVWRWSGVTLIAIAALADMTGDSWNTRGPTWTESVVEARGACDSGSTTVEVQLTPTDVPMAWKAELTCDWLSRD